MQKKNTLNVVLIHERLFSTEFADMIEKKDAEEIRRFTFIAAHDLREPLTTNDNYINMLNDHLSEQADEFTTRMMDTIRQGNQRMRKLIIGILEFGSLFNDQQEFGAVELKSVFTEAERMLENKFKENGA